MPEDADAERQPGSSIASITPSSAWAVTTSPSPTRSTPWWWWECTSSPSPTARATTLPGVVTRWWRPKVASSARCGVTSIESARCWSRGPPRTTFRSCMPRQMPSTGIRRAIARPPAANVATPKPIAGGGRRAAPLLQRALRSSRRRKRYGRPTPRRRSPRCDPRCTFRSRRRHSPGRSRLGPADMWRNSPSRVTNGSHARPRRRARPEIGSAPLAAAPATSSKPVASRSQVRGSVSTDVRRIATPMCRP